jgi:hypothetical protein
VEHIRQMVLQQLPTALSLDRHERQLVANDILDGRYYNLLLPDRLDCHEPLPRVVKDDDDDDAPRRRLQASNTECPICLNELGVDYALTTIVQCCGQRFCTACVAHLTRQHQERQNNAAAALCPLCRTTMMTTTTSPLSSAAMIMPPPPMVIAVPVHASYNPTVHGQMGSSVSSLHYDRSGGSSSNVASPRHRRSFWRSDRATL